MSSNSYAHSDILRAISGTTNTRTQNRFGIWPNECSHHVGHVLFDGVAYLIYSIHESSHGENQYSRYYYSTFFSPIARSDVGR